MTEQLPLIACPDCDLLQREVPVPAGGAARCGRCGVVLYRNRPDSLDRTLAYALAAAVAFVVGNTIPLMSLSAVGRSASTTVIGGVREMWQDGQPATALLVAFCAVLAPALDIAFTLAILLGARRPRAPRWVGTFLRWSPFVRPWRMVEVMMLGILVALIKIAELATVTTDIGMYAILALMMLLAAMASSFEPRQVWARVRWVDEERQLAGAVSESAGAGVGR
jgi:paraquat-inducible protein A